VAPECVSYKPFMWTVSVQRKVVKSVNKMHERNRGGVRPQRGRSLKVLLVAEGGVRRRGGVSRCCCVTEYQVESGRSSWTLTPQPERRHCGESLPLAVAGQRSEVTRCMWFDLSTCLSVCLSVWCSLLDTPTHGARPQLYYSFICEEIFSNLNNEQDSRDSRFKKLNRHVHIQDIQWNVQKNRKIIFTIFKVLYLR